MSAQLCDACMRPLPAHLPSELAACGLYDPWATPDPLVLEFCRCEHPIADHGEDEECTWCGCGELRSAGMREVG